MEKGSSCSKEEKLSKVSPSTVSGEMGLRGGETRGPQRQGGEAAVCKKGSFVQEKRENDFGWKKGGTKAWGCRNR